MEIWHGVTNNIVEGNLETKLATYEQMQHDAATVVRRIRERKESEEKESEERRSMRAKS